MSLPVSRQGGLQNHLGGASLLQQHGAPFPNLILYFPTRMVVLLSLSKPSLCRVRLSLSVKLSCTAIPFSVFTRQ